MEATKMKIFRSILTVMVLSLAGCNQPNPYKIDKAAFESKVHTVGIMPAAINPHIKVINRDEKEKEFEALIESKLSEAGFKVIPCSEYRAVYQPMKQSIGPLFDANTGEPLETNRDMILDYSKREYLTKYKVDALVWPNIESVKATWGTNIATWDGAQEPAMGKDGILERMVLSNFSGTLPALSLKLTIADPNGHPMYENPGGIQLLAWLTMSSGFQDVPKENLLANKERNRKSVDIACKPLFKQKK
jgi:hypothetical protein